MESKKDLTKELLADCFKELMLTRPFDKITIKTITDRAGLIRPTFYKHFQDKYEVMEWIFRTDIVDQVNLLIDSGMVSDALLMLCKGLEKDRAFYKKALTVTGPNSFYEILEKCTFEAFLKIAKRYPLKTKDTIPMLTYERIAMFYTHSLVHVIVDWLSEEINCSSEELVQAYNYLMMHLALDMIT